MARSICPTCGRAYKGLERYCTKCGVELEKDKNRCSAMGTQLCRNRVFEDDDTFCCYCGALTTFAEARKEKGEIIPELGSRSD